MSCYMSVEKIDNFLWTKLLVSTALRRCTDVCCVNILAFTAQQEIKGKEAEILQHKDGKC